MVDRRFDPMSGQTKDYKIGICYFSAEHAALSSKNKDGLAQNQDNTSEWSNIMTLYTHGLLFQVATTEKIQLRILV